MFTERGGRRNHLAGSAGKWKTLGNSVQERQEVLFSQSVIFRLGAWLHSWVERKMLKEQDSLWQVMLGHWLDLRHKWPPMRINATRRVRGSMDFFFFFETASHVPQAGLNLPIYP